MLKALLIGGMAIALGISCLTYVTAEFDNVQTESMEKRYADEHFIEQVAHKLNVEPEHVTLEITDNRRIIYRVDNHAYSPKITDANIDYLQEIIE